MEKQSKAGAIIISAFKLCYKAVVIKTVRYWHKNRSKEQNKEPENKPTIIWSSNLSQSRKEYPMGKRKSLQQIVLGKLYSYMQKNETGPFSYTIHKNKFKMN